MARRTILVVVGLALALGACGGGDDSGTAADGTTTSAAGAVTTAAVPTSAPAAELPKFVSEFDRVCTTQVGFPGATSYEPVPGVHPMVFFDDFRGEGFVSSSRTFPQGWAVTEDANFDDNSELKAVQLVACADRVKETPNGTKCEFTSDGQKVTLELVDSVYDLKVYAATTGKELKTTTLEAKKTECPVFAAFKKGDTKYVNEPSDDDYTNALKPTVAP